MAGSLNSMEITQFRFDVIFISARMYKSTLTQYLATGNKNEGDLVISLQWNYHPVQSSHRSISLQYKIWYPKYGTINIALETVTSSKAEKKTEDKIAAQPEEQQEWVQHVKGNLFRKLSNKSMG